MKGKKALIEPLVVVPVIDKLPAVQWKLTNLAKMDRKKRAQALSALKKVLDV